MIITIDTQKDSKEEMLRAIRMLQELVGITPSVTENAPTQELELEEGVLSMFDVDEPPKKKSSSSTIIPYD